MTTKKHIWMIFLALLLLAGCARYTDTPPGLQGPGSTADPDTPASEDGDSTAPSDSSPDLPAGPRLPYVAAEFGAPVTRNGRFPIDEETSDAIQALVNLDGEMLADCRTVQEAEMLPSIWLRDVDGRDIYIEQQQGQLLVSVDDTIYIYPQEVDLEPAYPLLEQAQLEAVLADRREITRIELSQVDYYDYGEDTTRYREISLDGEQSQEVWELLQTDRWETVERFTAHYLSRGWADFIYLYHGEELIAQITDGFFIGETEYTVVFYRIDGQQDQMANILAPPEVYDSLYHLFDDIA